MHGMNELLIVTCNNDNHAPQSPSNAIIQNGTVSIEHSFEARKKCPFQIGLSRLADVSCQLVAAGWPSIIM